MPTGSRMGAETRRRDGEGRAEVLPEGAGMSGKLEPVTGSLDKGVGQPGLAMPWARAPGATSCPIRCPRGIDNEGPLKGIMDQSTRPCRPCPRPIRPRCTASNEQHVVHEPGRRHWPGSTSRDQRAHTSRRRARRGRRLHPPSPVPRVPENHPFDKQTKERKEKRVANAASAVSSR